MRVIRAICAIVTYCTLMTYASAECEDVRFGDVFTTSEGKSFSQSFQNKKNEHALGKRGASALRTRSRRGRGK